MMSSSGMERQARDGVTGMDREHAVELQLVRALQVALRASDEEATRELLGQLEDFTAAHFMSEQILMRLHAYPAYQAHQQEHDTLIDELREIRRRIEAGEHAEPEKAIAEVEDWLLAHMHSSDEDLARFLDQGGS